MDRSALPFEIPPAPPAACPDRAVPLRDARSPSPLWNASAQTTCGSASLSVSGRKPAYKGHRPSRNSAEPRHPDLSHRYFWPYRQWRAELQARSAVLLPRASDVSFVSPRLQSLRRTIFAGQAVPTPRARNWESTRWKKEPLWLRL